MPQYIAMRRLQYLIVFVLLYASQACTVNYIADYDEVTDQSLMNLQRKFDTFFFQLEDKIGTPAADYDLHKQFYQQTKVDIGSLRMRVEAMPLNSLTTKAVGLLAENLDLLESLHQTGIDDIAVVNLVRDDFNRSLTNILRLELAKKRGEQGL